MNSAVPSSSPMNTSASSAQSTAASVTVMLKLSASLTWGATNADSSCRVIPTASGPSTLPTRGSPSPGGADRCASIAQTRSLSVGAATDSDLSEVRTIAGQAYHLRPGGSPARARTWPASQLGLDAGVGAEARLHESHRILVLAVEQGIDAAGERPGLGP